MCDATSGCCWNSKAMFVKAPVAINQAVPFGVESKALAMDSMNGPVAWAMVGVGRRDVPSRPEAP